MPTFSVNTLLREAEHRLRRQVPNSRLEAEVLLAASLNKPKAYLFAHPEANIEESIREKFFVNLARREQGEPIAYILGQREFWSLSLEVTVDTLIPRSETERLVELVLAQLPQQACLKIADLGTGSGAIALALASTCPAWEIHAVDIEVATLAVARRNAERLGIRNVSFHQGSWCDALLPGSRLTAVVSNPPYLSSNDPHLQQGDLRFEPNKALVSGPQGLEALKQVISQASDYLVSGGYLFLEHGGDQAVVVCDCLQQQGYVAIQTYTDYGGCARVSCAQWFG